MRGTPEVSVIIPCRNAANHLPRMLTSLSAQTFRAAWEVILVDNRSTDGSSSVALGFADRLDLKVVTARRKSNASYARNEGVRRASADKLLFVDADDEVEPEYVHAMADALDSHAFVASRVDARTLNPQWTYDAQDDPWQETGIDVAFDFLPATGINVGVRRALFQSIGGFPEEYSGSQDIAFSWDVQLKAGVRIHFVPEAVYRYRHRGSLRGTYRQSSNWGFSNVLLYRQFRGYGMPGKTLRMAAWEWKDVLVRLAGARSKGDLAPLLVRLGYCVGRLKGSLRYRVMYL